MPHAKKAQTTNVVMHILIMVVIKFYLFLTERFFLFNLALFFIYKLSIEIVTILYYCFCRTILLCI